MSLPPNFIKNLSEKKVIPFVGAGVSMNVKDKSDNDLFPSWKNLLLASAKKLKENGKEAEVKLVEGNLEINSPNYLEAAKQAQKYLGSTKALNLINEFLRLESKNNSDYKLLIKQRARILNQTKRVGFRQEPVNPNKKKRKKKRR